MSGAAAAALVTMGLASSLPTATAAGADYTAPGKISAQHVFTPGKYIVRLAADPIGSYQGDVRGLTATKPAPGQKVNPAASAVKRYKSYLDSQAAKVLAKVGNPKRIYDYRYAFSGFAAQLTATQATKLAADPNVLSVSKVTLQHPTARPPAATTPDTSTADFLGLSAKNGTWSQLGGPDRAGDGIVVGVIDSGIWPESASFAPLHKPVPDKWKGSCQGGADFPSSTCNDKLIGARWYVAGYGADNVSSEDFLSPRDGSGHGTHTSSTAAGDYGVRATIQGQDVGTISGMAPAARVAMYKVCWEGKPGVNAGCSTDDSVAAIDQAVADGVDVINYSIGGSSESDFFDPVEWAFLEAANAGVFVSASAGNSGPDASTLDHPSPWLTTVAASTYQVYESTVELGDGTKMIGASTTPGIPNFTPLISSVDAKAAGVEDKAAALCEQDTLDPGKVKGKIVLCDRGVIARIDKSLEVERAGGVGMVLVNPTEQGVNADYHFVPTVHLEANYYDAIHKYTDGNPKATARILAGVHVGSTTKVPRVIEFSSRGPATHADGDLLKPDIAAPGVDVLASVAPPSNHWRNFDFMSGTSMAAPHIAGLAALVKQAHPTWSPMMIKSAMMTTARPTIGTTSPFEQGSGNVLPTKMLDPGLVFDSGIKNWLDFLAGQPCPPQAAMACKLGRPMSASDLNLASIAIGDMPGEEMVTRTVTGVGRGLETFRPKVTGLAGIKVSINRPSLTVRENGTASFAVDFTRTTAKLDEWSTGQITWYGTRGHVVTMPVAIRPVAIKAPAEISGTGASGSTTISVRPGFSGSLTSAVAGLTGATPQAGTVSKPADGSAAFDPTDPKPGPDAKEYTVQVPAGTRAIRFDTRGHTGDDIDLYAYLGTPSGDSLVGVSGTATANERITFDQPISKPTTLTFIVAYFSAANGSSADYTATSWVVPGEDAGNLAVTPNPATVTQGAPTTLTATWSGLDTAKRYFGVIDYKNGSQVVGDTLVSIE